MWRPVGIFQTPQLLELSGIGRRRVLAEYGITPVLELPVGENLRESTALTSRYVSVFDQVGRSLPVHVATSQR